MTEWIPLLCFFNSDTCCNTAHYVFPPFFCIFLKISFLDWILSDRAAFTDLPKIQ